MANVPPKKPAQTGRGAVAVPMPPKAPTSSPGKSGT